MPTFEFVGIDSDGDGIKDHIDEDDDNDGIFDEFDPYPLDPTLPGSSVACNEEDQELVFESINWSVQPGQTVIEIPADGVVASQFTTTSASSFSGWVTLVPTTGTGYASFDLWISSCPGGTPVAQEYNGCFSSGGEASVRWSQEPEPRLLTSCKLQTDTVYYLNYATTGCNASFCGAFRNTRYIN